MAVENAIESTVPKSSEVAFYRYEVNTVSCPEGVFTGNAVKCDTEEQAIEAAKDLFMRWHAVREWRVVTNHGEVVASGP